jgi:hypothetical protein
MKEKFDKNTEILKKNLNSGNEKLCKSNLKLQMRVEGW